MTKTPATTDYTELRKAAEAATPGPWYETETEVFSAGAELHIAGAHDAPRSANATFIALANPAAIIALLDAHATVVAERDALLGQNARLQALVSQEQRVSDELRDAVIGMGANAIALKYFAETLTGTPLKSHLLGIAEDINATARSAYEATEPKE